MDVDDEEDDNEINGENNITWTINNIFLLAKKLF